MIDDTAADEGVFETDQGAADRTGERTGLRRFLPLLILGGIALAISAPLLFWLYYRHGYVVSTNAWVRGRVAYVGAPMRGVVADVLVDDGDRVRAGQVLARLRDNQLKAQVRSAESHLDQVTRELEVERLAIVQERRRQGSLVAKANADQAAAGSRADDAKARQALLASLAGSGVSPREDLRMAEAGSRTASAEWEAARATERAVWVEFQGLGVRERRMAVLESRVSAAQADLAERQAALEEATIRAPDDGQVVRRTAEAGTSVEYGDPILSVWLGSRLWVEAWVDEEDLGDVKLGSAATITVKSFPGRVFYGVVEAVGSAPDFAVPDSDVPQPFHTRMRNSPVFLVRIGLGDADGLLPGLSAEVGISMDEVQAPRATPPTAELDKPK